MSQIVDVKLTHRTSSGTLLRSPATLQFVDGRIFFLKSPFSLKDEIKVMAGSKWHGYIDGDKRKIWSVDDCVRNRFQLGYLMGEDVYAWFDRDLIRHNYRDYIYKGEPTDPMGHQFDMADMGLTYHYQIWGAEMGTGKTLAAQMVIEHAGVDWWIWAGPAKSIPNMKREFRLWEYNDAAKISFVSYDKLKRIVDEWKPGDPLPQGLVCDESSRCKNCSSQRSVAVQRLGDRIREQYHFDGYVIEMSGTPSPKKPTDWWSQCEIAWPGFLREGSVKALENRLAFMVKKEYESTGVIWASDGWKDDENKCAECGDFAEAACHTREDFMNEGGGDDYHEFVPSKNEVSYMYERLKGLVGIWHKKDVMGDLPDKRYRKVMCEPKPSVLRVAKALVSSTDNTMHASMLCRELSDGFQYREEKDGMKPCGHCVESCGEVDEWYHPDKGGTFYDISLLPEEMVADLKKRRVKCPACKGNKEVTRMVRIARMVPCPKEAALRDLLEENWEVGRLVVFAGFTGSVDRCVDICHKEGWAVVRCDGRGYQVTLADGSTVTGVDALDWWADLENNVHVAFVAHPESGGMSLTLTEARMSVYWSNSFKPEYRTQSEDRIHRKGMDVNLGCTIVDLIHLPTDERVLEIIRDNRRLELMTMGEVMKGIDFGTEVAVT